MRSKFRPKSSTFFRVHGTLVRIHLSKIYIYWWVWLPKEEFFYHHRCAKARAHERAKIENRWNWVKIENAMTLFYVDVSDGGRRKRRSSREKAYHASFIAFKRCWHIKSLLFFPPHFFIRRRMSAESVPSSGRTCLRIIEYCGNFSDISSRAIYTQRIYRIKSLVYVCKVSSFELSPRSEKIKVGKFVSKKQTID